MGLEAKQNTAAEGEQGARGKGKRVTKEQWKLQKQ